LVSSPTPSSHLSFAFFLLLLQQGLFLQDSAPPVEWHVLPRLGG
jgi:hypothetical protein